MGQVTFDVGIGKNQGGASSTVVTSTITIGNNPNRIAYIFAQYEEGVLGTVSANINGSTATVFSSRRSSDGGGEIVCMYLVNPPVGLSTITVNNSAGGRWGIAAFVVYNADTSNPVLSTQSTGGFGGGSSLIISSVGAESSGMSFGVMTRSGNAAFSTAYGETTAVYFANYGGDFMSVYRATTAGDNSTLGCAFANGNQVWSMQGWLVGSGSTATAGGGPSFTVSIWG